MYIACVKYNSSLLSFVNVTGNEEPRHHLPDVNTKPSLELPDRGRIKAILGDDFKQKALTSGALSTAQGCDEVLATDQRPSLHPSLAVFRNREKADLSNPFIEMVAMRIHPKWRQLAFKLGFNDDDCEEFEVGDNSVGPWLPCFRMLDAFRAQLSETEAENGKRILADAIRPLDEHLSHKITGLDIGTCS